MKFVIDLDDTICDTNAYSEKYIKRFIIEHNSPIKFIGTIARFAEAKFDWDRDSALEWYKTYGDEMMLHFPIKGDALEIINSLYNQGHEIVICTARETGWHKDPKGTTMKWLENVGLKYHKVYIGRDDKENVCKIEQADVFVDDDLKIISRVNEYFHSIGKGTIFLMTTDYNKDLEVPEGVKRSNNFCEVVKHLNLK